MDSIHSAMSRSSHASRRPTLMAGANRPSCRSQRTVRTGTRNRSATSSMFSNSVMSNLPHPRSITGVAELKRSAERVVSPAGTQHAIAGARGWTRRSVAGSRVRGHGQGRAVSTRTSRAIFGLRGAVAVTGRRCDARGFEGLPDHFGPVRAMVAQRLAGPLPGYEDAAATDAEVPAIVRLARAPAGLHPGFRMPGLDSEPEPVRTVRRARQIFHVLVQPIQM
jgi:hypothetical protein